METDRKWHLLHANGDTGVCKVCIYIYIHIYVYIYVYVICMCVNIYIYIYIITLPCCEHWPCNPAETTALQPLIWCSGGVYFQGSSSPEECFFRRRRYQFDVSNQNTCDHECRVMLRRGTPKHAALCHARPCDAMSRHTMLPFPF